VKRGAVLAFAAFAAIAALAWWHVRAQPIAIVDAPIDRLPCVSYTPFRKPGQSPLVTGARASVVQMDADLAALARLTRCIRTYSVDQGLDEVPRLARKHGLRVLLGVWIGRDAAKILAEIGVQAEPAPRLLIADVPRDHSLVWTEQMMPVLPVVRVGTVDQAIDLAVRAEHGFRHTASIHSTNVETITRMARAMNCSIFVTNGPNVAGLGEGGEGFSSFSIASPTGDGLTRPRTFSRERRITVVGALRIV